jgi:hypothetical protein
MEALAWRGWFGNDGALPSGFGNDRALPSGFGNDRALPSGAGNDGALPSKKKPSQGRFPEGSR